MKQLLNISGLAIAFMITFSSCGGNAEKESTTTQSAETSTLEAEPVKPDESKLSNVLALEGNDQMQYNQTEFKVAAGQTITLTLKHTGKLEKNAMGHNFVLLKPGTDVNTFAQKALGAKDNDYIPKSESASIIAHTKLLGGGESDTITFTVIEKGTYDFICSFPGHVSMMKGKLIAE
ncbi:azurin [Pedobacter nyackensis]|uniref:Azurin n=1 Tax=Pedobacter nyackensis TaxID=475255 RepID=A0A1W2DW79_9SPHI|nr:azurin [Pedobacter nyackensis]SMD01693.1 azurin [Pedobacter nyackensis]